MKEQSECEVYSSGTKEWRLHENLHREDGPAIEYADGGKEWLLHGKCHREDGPAVEDADGHKEWFLHGKRVHPETLVELHLSRGTFCYYNEQTQTLHFDESNERTT